VVTIGLMLPAQRAKFEAFSSQAGVTTPDHQQSTVWRCCGVTLAGMWRGGGLKRQWFAEKGYVSGSGLKDLPSHAIFDRRPAGGTVGIRHRDGIDRLDVFHREE